MVATSYHGPPSVPCEGDLGGAIDPVRRRRLTGADGNLSAGQIDHCEAGLTADDRVSSVRCQSDGHDGPRQREGSTDATIPGRPLDQLTAVLKGVERAWIKIHVPADRHAVVG